MNGKEIKDSVQVQVRVRLAKEVPFWGPGTEQVMRGIKSTESVRDACRETGISYSKARKIIDKAEKGWEVSLVERHQGGKNGGVSHVTEEGEKCMALFEELEKEVQKFAEEKYRELEAHYFLDNE